MIHNDCMLNSFMPDKSRPKEASSQCHFCNCSLDIFSNIGKKISKNAEQLSYNGKMVLNHSTTSVLKSYKILYYITFVVEENTED